MLYKWLETSQVLKKGNDVVTVIDVHTGLGRKGEDTLLFTDTAQQDKICHWFPGSECVSEQAGSVSSGYEGVRGFVIDHLMEQTTTAANALPHAAVAQEFGTLPAVLVGNALVVENAGRQSGLEWGNWTTRRVFYPADAEWRSKVISNGLRLLRQAMERSVKLSTEVANNMTAEESSSSA